jgi:zinc/manganese transport system substrate-binding protein
MTATRIFAPAVALASILAGGGPAAAVQDPVRVVATLPVYESIVRAIGGNQVDVSSIADPREDAHFVRPKPSFAADIRRADMFITTGLDLELWVPTLLDRAGNSNVSEGGRGYVTAYTGVRLLEVPVNADRSAGDIHIYGNPHVYTDPLNTIQVARNITAGLKKVAPERSAVWDRGFASFSDRIYRRLYGDRLVEIVTGEGLANLSRQGNLISFLEATPFEGTPLIQMLGGWLAQGSALRGAEVICDHRNWAYFTDRFGMTCVDYLEPKPGIPPTPGHVAKLIELMKSRDIGVIVAATYFGRDRVQTIAQRSGAQPVIIPFQTGDGPGLATYESLVDRWVSSLSAAITP